MALPGALESRHNLELDNRRDFLMADRLFLPPGQVSFPCTSGPKRLVRGLSRIMADIQHGCTYWRRSLLGCSIQGRLLRRGLNRLCIVFSVMLLLSGQGESSLRCCIVFLDRADTSRKSPSRLSHSACQKPVPIVFCPRSASFRNWNPSPRGLQRTVRPIPGRRDKYPYWN